MQKFKIWASKCYEIEIDAKNEIEATEKALAIPFDEWLDNYELDLGCETIEEENSETSNAN